MQQCPQAIFITGTDTDVGKTVATAAIGRALTAAGRRVGVLKPAQTGVAPGQPADAEFVLRALDSAQDPATACPYRFVAPAAPWVAARAEGRPIDIVPVRAGLERLRAAYDVVLVEGAGGLLVPFADGQSMADLAGALALPLVIVARPGLGTINHTLLTVEAARARGLIVLGVLLSGWAPTDDLATRTNPAIIRELGRVPLLGVLPHDPALSVERLEPSGLATWAPTAVGPLFGGTFDADAFLVECRP